MNKMIIYELTPSLLGGGAKIIQLFVLVINTMTVEFK